MTYLIEQLIGKTTRYLFPIPNLNVGDKMVYLDATVIVKDGLTKDKELGYKKHGPNFAIEVQRAIDYSHYVSSVSPRVETVGDKYNTRDYTFIQDVLPEQMRVKSTNVPPDVSKHKR